MSAVCWTSCLVCLKRFAFPLCSRWHPLLCAEHAHLVDYDARVGAAATEASDAAR